MLQTSFALPASSGTRQQLVGPWRAEGRREGKWSTLVFPSRGGGEPCVRWMAASPSLLSLTERRLIVDRSSTDH